MTHETELNIRPARAADAALICRFIGDLAEYEKLSSEVVATPERIERTLFGDRPGAEVLIAEWNGEAAGFALYFPTYSTFLARAGMHLEDLFVSPDYRGRGIGKALLAHLAKICADRGYGRLEWSVLDWNEPAIEFYLQIGARAMDDWTNYRLDGNALAAMGGEGSRA